MLFRSKISSLNTTINELNSEITRLVAREKDLEQENEKLESLKVDYDNQINSLNTTVDQVNGEITRLTAKVRELENQKEHYNLSIQSKQVF